MAKKKLTALPTLTTGFAGPDLVPVVDVSASTTFKVALSDLVTGLLDLVDNASPAAAGTLQTDATAITATINNVTVGTSNMGVKLPTATALSQVMIVRNSHATNVLKVWPNTSGTINGAAANASIDVAGTKIRILFSNSTTAWLATGDL